MEDLVFSLGTNAIFYLVIVWLYVLGMPDLNVLEKIMHYDSDRTCIYMS